MIARVLLACAVAAAAVCASGEGGAQQEGSTIAPLPGLETWDGMGGGALPGSPAEQDEAAAEGTAPADVGDAETELAAPEERAADAALAAEAAAGDAASDAEEPAESAPARTERQEAEGGAGWARPELPVSEVRRDEVAPEVLPAAAVEDSVPVQPPSGTEGRGTVRAVPASVPSPPVTAEPVARGSLWRLLDERADREAGESAAAFVADMAREGCPRDLIGRLLAGAVDERDGLTALALEREILVLCRKRQEAVTAVLEQEAVLRELAGRPRAERPELRESAPEDWGEAIDAVPELGLVAAVEEEPRDEEAEERVEPAPAPAGPAYRWFTLAGSGGDLRAGVTDGTGVWFVRAGDGLPGGVRVTEIGADPPGVHVEGAAGGALPWGPAP